MPDRNDGLLTDLCVAVLGGSGFIGRHLVEGLFSAGATVRAFDRAPSRWHGPLVPSVHVGDFVSGEGLDEVLDGADIVYHLISTTIPSTSNADPTFDVQTNLLGTLSLLRRMKERGVRRIVFLSSGGTVYGDPSVLPVHEQHELRPLCSYGIVKVAIEHYLRMAAELEGFDATVLRLANPFGPGQNRLGVHGVIPTFLSKMMSGGTIEVCGDGSTVRDYIYCTDVVDAMLLFARAQYGSGFKVYNVGSGEGHRLTDVIGILSEVTGLPAHVSYVAQRAYDVRRTFLDIGKLTRDTGWTPSVSLIEGCRRCWNVLSQDAEQEPSLAMPDIASHPAGLVLDGRGGREVR